MSALIGKISSIDGKFYAKSVDGSLREINSGSEIYVGESIVGDKANFPEQNVVVHMEKDFGDIIILGKQTQLFDASLASEGFDVAEVVTTGESIQDAIASILDENLDDIDTAAGEESAISSSEGGEANFASFNNASIDIQASTRERTFDNTQQTQEDDSTNQGEEARRAQNDAPTLSLENTKTVDEDGTTTITFNAQDVDGTTTTTATADNGAVVVNNDGTITYTPNADYNGTDTVTVTTTDDDGESVTQTSSITINPMNDNPIAFNDTITEVQNQLVDVTPTHASINVGDGVTDFTNAFTISQTITSTGNGGIIFNKENAYEIAQESNGSIRYALRADNGSGWVWNDTGYDLAFNETHDLSFVYDGASNTVKLYVDGVEVSSNTQNVPDTLINYNNDLLFGERGNNNQSFEGTFDDIQIHNTAL